MMNKQIYDKLDEPITNYNVLEVFTFLKQSVRDRTILVLTKPPKVVYKTLSAKIGNPKDFSDNAKQAGFF